MASYELNASEGWIGRLARRLVWPLCGAGLLAGCALADDALPPRADDGPAPSGPVAPARGLPHAVLVEDASGRAHHLHIAPLVANGRFTSGFGRRRSTMGGASAHHTGIDISAPEGTPIRAAAAGRIVQMGRFGGYGRVLRIRHGEALDTFYAHLSRYAKRLEVGQEVRQGQVVAYVGRSGRTSGAHLHLELRRAGKPVDPLSFPQVGPRR